MSLSIIKTDITTMAVDAIVNAANAGLQMGGGVCGAIFRAAGPQKLQEACNKLAPIKTGEAVITNGFDAKAKFIIHTAGPIYDPTDKQQAEQLSNCYSNSLKLAAQNNLTSIAFPLISAGIYGYPLQRNRKPYADENRCSRRYSRKNRVSQRVWRVRPQYVRSSKDES